MPSSHLSQVYRPNFGLLTDFYEITMAYGYWHGKLQQRSAVFHLYYRRNPFGHPYVLASGLALAVDYLARFTFDVADIQYLGGLKGADNRSLFPEAFLHYLQRLSFTGDLDAVPEGTVVFPNEPLLRITAPLAQAQLVETALLTLINFSSLITTKAARVVQAAQGDQVLEFGLRRAQGIDGGLTAARAAYIGGCHGSSNTWAGRYYGIPVRGTHAHSWVMVFDDETSAFEHYAEALPNNCIFLVDTYDTLDGVRNAIPVALELRKKGHELLGIRLDSGDLLQLSRAARQLLDEAGLTEVAIVASNDLDEDRIAELKAGGAAINVWGVGTRLVTGHDQAALGGVYKLAAVADEQGGWDYRIKISEQAVKTTIPGPQQLRRFFTKDGFPLGDMLYLTDQTPDENQWFTSTGEVVQAPADATYQDLLQPVLQAGRLVADLPTLPAIRDHCLQQQALFNRMDWSKFSVGLSTELYRLKESMIAEK